MRLLRHIALVLVLIALVWLALVGVAVLFVEGTLWLTGVLGLQHALGMDTQGSHNYASVSGSLPIIVAALGFSGMIGGAWHRLNCHTKGCPRIGRHHMAGGKYVICTPCLRSGEREPKKMTREHIHEEHRRHVARRL